MIIRYAMACMTAMVLIFWGVVASGDGGDTNYVHACAKVANGNTRIVGSEELCKGNEHSVHWPKEIPQAHTDPAVLGRIQALESQIQSLQQDVASLVEFAAPPDISINDVEFLENCTISADATLTISLTKPAQFIVSANYSTVDGTASASDYDYEVETGAIEFQPGETVGTVGIRINCDFRPELDESFFVELSNISYANAGDTVGEIQIINDDSAELSMELLSSSGSLPVNGGAKIVPESANLIFQVRMKNPSPYSVSVDYSIIGDPINVQASPATIDDFLAPTSGTLLFQPQETVKTFSIVLVDDQIAEGIEGMLVVLNNPVNALFYGGAESLAQEFAINDDDVVATIGAVPQTVTEGTEPRFMYSSRLPTTTSVDLTVTLSEATAGPVVVALTLDQNLSTATRALNYVALGLDYSNCYFGWCGDIGLGGTSLTNEWHLLTIEPGQMSYVHSAPLLSDDLPEETEVAVVSAVRSYGAMISDPSLVEITILDDD